MHGRLGAVEGLVKAGASVNRKDVQGGFTPMHLAADAGQCEAMEALLKAGASLNPRSTQGWTPLGLATLKVSLTDGCLTEPGTCLLTCRGRQAMKD